MADVLIVDDDADLAYLLRRRLRLDGYRVRTACDGLEGLARLNERMADVVVLDVEMPGLTGPEVALRMFLRNCGLENIPVVLASGAANLPAIARSVGTPYVVPKPYSMSDIRETIDRALRERRSPTPPVLP